MGRRYFRFLGKFNLKRYIRSTSYVCADDVVEEITKEEVYDLIYYKLDEVLGYFQDKMGITSGDVSPMDLYDYEELLGQLSECVLRILHGQLPYNEDEDDDEDWRYK